MVRDVHNHVYLIGIPITTVGYDNFVKQLAIILKLS